MIQVSNLTKVFPGKKGTSVTAVNNITFRCKSGEIYGLLGPNGAGKTTTLRMLSTALKPTSGEAFVNGFDVSKAADQVRQSVGFLSSATGLYRRLTAKEMILYYGKLYGMNSSQLKSRAEELISIMGVTSFANQRCDKLSTGQKQRVSICRSIIADPPVMIFDEPAEGLDILAADIIVEFIGDCRKRGKCVIFSTHIMKEAESLCDRIGIIDRGVLKVEGTLSELKNRYSGDSLDEVFRKAVRS